MRCVMQCAPFDLSTPLRAVYPELVEGLGTGCSRRVKSEHERQAMQMIWENHITLSLTAPHESSTVKHDLVALEPKKLSHHFSLSQQRIERLLVVRTIRQLSPNGAV